MHSASSVFLVRPANFGFNAQTAASNAFQKASTEAVDELRAKALNEFDAFAKTLKTAGINVLVFEDTPTPIKPDAVFPNNWLSLHADGTLVLYPMCAPNRRAERREDILNELKKQFQVKRVIDLSVHEKENGFLEGTGSIVFDHTGKIAYACLSPRTHPEILDEICEKISYRPVVFHALDAAGKEIYHTNVMMCVCEKLAIVCSESIKDNKERELVISTLKETGRAVIHISLDQMNHFAGNMLGLRTKSDDDLLVLSQSAFNALDASQKKEIEKFCRLLLLAIPTIESVGGGSARCMIAEIFLPPL